MGQRVGVVGGGQLAWMMGTAAQKLGIELVVQTPQMTDPAVSVAADTVLGAIADAEVTAQLAQTCDVITFENEFVDLDALECLAQQGVTFAPRLSALRPLLDKYHQRQFLHQHNIPMPDFAVLDVAPSPPANSAPNSDPIAATSLPGGFTFPVVLKARRHGYDGQGTHILQSSTDLQAVLTQQSQVDWMVEAFVPFERELAVMAARFADGTVVVYPVVETVQQNQVCCRVFALPQDWTPDIVRQAEAIATTVLNGLEVVGIFGFEFFLTRDGQVWVNEIAPRTHNSGHYTLDACTTSQFEQQLRAVTGLPPGPIQPNRPAVMVNLLGFESAQSDYSERRSALKQIPNAHVCWYGKSQSRPGRKLGHVTVLLYSDKNTDKNPDENSDENSDEPANLRPTAEAIAHQVEAIWYP